jgi:hypothetical protein
MRLLVVLVLFSVPMQAMATAVMADLNYCEGLALMTKATTEAKQRGETEESWRKNLQALKGYVVKNKDNVLYSVLPKVIQDVDPVWNNKLSPMDTYMASYNSCMMNDYGKAVVLTY